MTQIVAKASAGSTVQASAGVNLRAMTPGDVGSDQFQLPDQLHILVARQRFKASGPSIGVSADAQIGAVDMPMTIAGPVVSVIVDLRRFIE